MPGPYSAILWQTRAGPQGGSLFYKIGSSPRVLLTRAVTNSSGTAAAMARSVTRVLSLPSSRAGKRSAGSLSKLPMKVAASSFGV